MKLHKLLLTVIAGSILFVSCSDDDTTTAPSGAYQGGVLVLNQGGFESGNAEVSFISDDMTVENNIFSGVNTTMALGDTAQDIGFMGDLAYIVVNNSQKIEVVNRYTFQHVATIDAGLSNPRYIAFANGKGYVTNWGAGSIATDDYVAVVDLASNTVTGTIPVAEGPEKVIEENGKLYVAHYGGWNFGNTVTVLNAANNTVVTTINVGDAPNGIDIVNGKLYVLSEGLPSWAGAETSGKLHVINTNDYSVGQVINFENAHPENLTLNNDNIFYTAGSGVYMMSVNAPALPAAPLFTTTGGFNPSAFAVRNGNIYLGDAGDYISNGKVYVHNLSGALHHTFTVGVVPAGFYFN